MNRLTFAGLTGCGLLSALAAAGPAAAWNVQLPPQAALAHLPAGAQTRPVAFTKMMIRMPQGQPYMTVEVGAFCLPQAPKVWTTAAVNSKPNATHLEEFNTELAAAGFKTVAADPSNLFDDSKAGSLADFEVGAVVTDLKEEFCEQAHLWKGGVGIKGVVRMDVEWQVYSRLESRVVAKINTAGGAEEDKPVDGEATLLVNEALDQNIKALLSSKEFVAAVSGTSSSVPQAGPVNSKFPLLSVAGGREPLAVPDSVGSVVAIFTPEGFGSGWIVGDGYLLTDRHVAGEGAKVKIRWSDGLETAGEVVRSDMRRDVSLIQTDTRGRPALAVRTAAIQPGDTVFAIGTPLSPELQNTVTRGVVSAIRTIDGLMFVQSDVTVNHGNSGGPLLDEKGRVVGLAVLALQPNGAPTGVNLFIPIRDALDFLSLSVSPQAVAEK